MLQFHLNLLLCVLQTPWSVDFSCSIDHSRSLAPTDWHSRLCGLIFYHYIQMGNDVTLWRMSVGLFYTKAYGLFTKKTIGKLTFRFFLIPLLLKIIRKGIYRIGTFLQFSICNLETAVIISLLVLLSGDIEENPGPLNSEYCVSLLHCYIRSIRNKLDYIINTFCDFDILCFTETHLDKTEDIALCNKYDHPYRKDRTNHDGGILAYVSAYLTHKRRNDLEIYWEENIWLETRINKQIYLIGIFYSPKTSNPVFLNSFNLNIEKSNGDNP